MLALCASKPVRRFFLPCSSMMMNWLPYSSTAIWPVGIAMAGKDKEEGELREKQEPPPPDKNDPAACLRH